MNTTSNITENLALQAFTILHSDKQPQFFAVNTSDVQPLPHQITAVYHQMLPNIPLRFLIADDPGAGKTIMTGLFLRELDLRSQLNNCLIVAPGSLAEQWQEELSLKFHLDFALMNENSDSGLLIAKLDTLARNNDLQLRISARSWDAIVIDEAHKLSVQVSGNDTHYTRRFHLGERLSHIARNFILLTATPHNGKPSEFRHFISLIHSDNNRRLRDSMRRLLKEELVKFDCSPLFPQRQAITVSYSLSPAEYHLYEAVTDYVRTQFNRAERLEDRRRGSAVGFALTLLQRRLASSPEAIFQSLRNRAEKLYNSRYDIPPDYDEIDDAETSADYVSASGDDAELQHEILTLRSLAQQAQHLRAEKQDVKWQKLSQLLQEDLNGEKIIVFTEHRATLDYLADRIRTLTGRFDSVLTIHGSMSLTERHRAEAAFRDNPDANILVATDAAGEGINLQCSHIVINYDLPWNPNRLEQRFGRIHRIGQSHKCLLFNLIAGNTREGQVFTRLFDKLEEEREALDGKVFDVLGNISFDGKSLSDILIDAIRTGNTPDIEHKNLLTAAQFHSSITRQEALSLLLSIEDAKSRLLPPDLIESFLKDALPILGATVYSAGKDTYEITYIPASVREHDKRIRHSYAQICFTPKAKGELITQAHPLLLAAARELAAHIAHGNSDSPAGRKLAELSAMEAVMAHERQLGNSPKDVSAQKLGYDIESTTPDGQLRAIEVKGRLMGAETVSITANEIRFALAHPDSFILAIVELDGDNTHIRYLTHMFRNEPDDAVKSITFGIEALVRVSECVYEK